MATCDFEIKTIVTLTKKRRRGDHGHLDHNQNTAEVQAAAWRSRTVVVTTRCVSCGGNSETQNGRVRGAPTKFESTRAIQQGLRGVNEVREHCQRESKTFARWKSLCRARTYTMVVGLRALTAWEESDITAKAMAFCQGQRRRQTRRTGLSVRPGMLGKHAACLERHRDLSTMSAAIRHCSAKV